MPYLWTFLEKIFIFSLLVASTQTPIYAIKVHTPTLSVAIHIQAQDSLHNKDMALQEVQVPFSLYLSVLVESLFEILFVLHLKD